MKSAFALLPIILAVASFAGTAPARAGGGPETVLVVVNADSADSRRVANAYAAMRGIPRSHLLHLRDVPATSHIDIAAFREKIWKPIAEHLERSGLADEIDVIAYSAGFPYAVDYDADRKPTPPLSRFASLTGLTYLARRVAARDLGYLDLGVNAYYRRDPTVRRLRPPTAEEREHLQRATAAIQAGEHAKAAEHYAAFTRTYVEHAGTWYNYACCLALTGEKDEAMAALERAVDAGWRDAAHTEKDTDLDSLRDHAGWAALLARMKQEPPLPAEGALVQPAHGFDADYVWTGADAPARPGEDGWRAGAPDRYYLAVMLGYTGEHGNTADEVVAYLERAARSDGTRPDGTVYLMKNDDVRSRTRQPWFDRTVAALERLGRKAAVLAKGEDGEDGVLPKGREDAIGIVAGIDVFDWSKSGSELLPGAIAEHLTSFGAHFDTNAQTKISAFLRAGAAGSAGAVAEPYAFAEKFPSPLLHVHYAEGCSLAEAFYQSIAGPHQLLVVGDPLARPFARFAQVALAAPDADAPWSGRVELTPTVTPAEGRPIARVELWVDGRRLAEAPSGEPLVWDTTKEDDGHHDVRLVAVERDRIETRSGHRLAVTVANGEVRPKVEVDAPRGPVAEDAKVKLAGRARRARQVELLDGERVLATAEASRQGKFELEVPASALGVGEVPLTVRATRRDGAPAVRSAPVTVRVVAAPPAKGAPSGR